MKKKLLTAAAILLVLLFSFIGYLQMREYRSYQDVVHKQADIIMKINADKIVQSLAWDYLTHPSDFFSFKKRRKGLKSGIEIPANIFLYNLSDKSSDTFFCKLALSDSALFKNFASKKLGIQSFNKIAKSMVGMSKNGRLTIAYSKNMVAIAFSLKKEKVTNILLEILDGKNMLNDEDPRFDRLKESNDHIAFLQNENRGSLNFEDGQVLLNASIALPEGFVPAEAVKHSQFPKESSMKMWFGANFTLKSKPFQIKEFNFYSDSLLKHYRGYMEATLTGAVRQQDTVVSYEYNDDFEKVEAINIVNKQVPGIYFSFKSDASGLYHYLQNQGVIWEKGMVNKKLFPLYNLYTSGNTEQFKIGTAEKNAADNKKEEYSDSFFYLWADFKRLKNENHFPLINKYIEKLSSLELKAKKDKKNITLSGSLSFTNKKINAFRQAKTVLGM